MLKKHIFIVILKLFTVFQKLNNFSPLRPQKRFL